MSHVTRTVVVVLAALTLIVTGCGPDEVLDALEEEPLPQEQVLATVVADQQDDGSTPADPEPTEPESADPEPADPEPTAATAADTAAAPTPVAIDYGDRWPEVLAVTATQQSGDTWRFDVTLSSPYDTAERYADAWRVLAADDTELGIRILGHDHANEQPFTRSTTVTIAPDTTTVWVEGRDQENGWSGQRFEVALTP